MLFLTFPFSFHLESRLPIAVTGQWLTIASIRRLRPSCASGCGPRQLWPEHSPQGNRGVAPLPSVPRDIAPDFPAVRKSAQDCHVHQE